MASCSEGVWECSVDGVRHCQPSTWPPPWLGGLRPSLENRVLGLSGAVPLPLLSDVQALQLSLHKWIFTMFEQTNHSKWISTVASVVPLRALLAFLRVELPGTVPIFRFVPGHKTHFQMSPCGTDPNKRENCCQRHELASTPFCRNTPLTFFSICAEADA